MTVRDCANNEYILWGYKLGSEGNHLFVKTFFVWFWFYSTGVFKHDETRNVRKKNGDLSFDNSCLANVHFACQWLKWFCLWHEVSTTHIMLPDSFKHDTKKSHTYVYTTLFKPQIRLMKLGNCPNTLAKWLKMLAKRRLTKRLLIEKHIKYSEVVYCTFKKNWSLNSITQDTPLLEKRKEVKKKIKIHHFWTPLVLDHISDSSIPLVLLLSPPQMFTFCSCPSPSRPLAGQEDLDTSSSFHCLCVSLFISSP